MKRLIVATITGCLAAMPAAAADLSDPEYRAEVAEQFPGVSAEDITPSSVDGLWEIAQDGVVGYVSADGRYLLDGDLIDLESDVNLSEQRRRDWRLARIDEIPEDDMLIFAPDAPEHTITVFTDVECAYCRHLHRRIDQLLDAGIRVRYLFYPLAGPQSSAYEKARAVWCSDDRRAALTAGMREESIPGQPGCGSPVETHYRMAVETLGLRGTPTIVTGQGRILPPGMPVSELVEEVLAAAE